VREAPFHHSKIPPAGHALRVSIAGNHLLDLIFLLPALLGTFLLLAHLFVNPAKWDGLTHKKD
jgi:hypothetical protein